MPALFKLKEQGKIRFTGVSGLPLKLFEQILPQIEVDAILSYCHYSLNDTTLLDLIPPLEERKDRPGQCFTAFHGVAEHPRNR